MAVVINGDTGISPVTASGTSASVDGMTVGRGGGEVTSNTVIGNAAGASNTTGSGITAIGYQTLYGNTIGVANTAVGGADGANSIPAALTTNSTGSYNIAIGTGALKSNSTASNNTAVGYQAGYTNSTGNWNTFIGKQAGQNTTGSLNTFIAGGAGSLVTNGSSNTIIGAYSGNAAGLDIRTASNYVVLSDGDGNPLQSSAYNKSTALQGAIPNTGIGITFPATQSASSDANTLDDYEEGTFTPTIIGTTSAGTGTYSNQTGSYIKVGQLVSIYIRMDWSAHTGTGYLAFAGLPFTSAGTYNNGAALNGMAGLTVAASCYVAANVNTSSTTGYFLQIPVGGGSDSQLAMDTGAIVIFTLTYRASA
jgi:hypothetical protein